MRSAALLDSVSKHHVDEVPRHSPVAQADRGHGVDSLSTTHVVQQPRASRLDRGWYDLLGEGKRHRPSVARRGPPPMTRGVQFYLSVFVPSFDSVGGGVAEVGLEAA